MDCVTRGAGEGLPLAVLLGKRCHGKRTPKTFCFTRDRTWTPWSPCTWKSSPDATRDYTRQESIPSSGVFQVFAENMRVQGAEVSGEEEAWLKMVDKKMS